MAKQNVALVAFNRGLVDRHALARIDLERLALSAEDMHNWVADTLGHMALRPGLKHIVGTKDNKLATYIPFVFAIDDTAIVELTDDEIRILVDEAPISFPVVSTTITNGDFTTNLTGWTAANDASTTSAWSADEGGSLKQTGTRSGAARLRQQLTVAGGDIGVEHAIVVDVARGPILFRIGTSAGGQQVITERELGTGLHVVSFTPTGNVWIQVARVGLYSTLVRSVTMHPGGDLVLTGGFAEAQLKNIRHDQSGDVIYIGCAGQPRRKVIRYAARSWSLADYEPTDGPFRAINISSTTLVSNVINGDANIVASKDLFEAGHVGALFRLESIGQDVREVITGGNQFSESVRVIGVGSANRLLNITITGTFSATVQVQRSIGEPGNWQDVTGVSFGAATTATYADGLDNQVVYYRIGVKSGEYTSGTVTAALSYPTGSISGVIRITKVTDAQNAEASILRDLGGTLATENWYEGRWSDKRGHPSCPTLHEGRLWWAGHDKIDGSISDAYESFDDTLEGDAGPISRSIGSGPVDKIFWMKSLERLVLGVSSRVFAAKSSSLDEPLTAENFNLKKSSSYGSANVDAVEIDDDCVFAQRSLSRVFELSIDAATLKYSTADLSVLVPEIGQPGIVKIGVQRQPDTRIHFVRSDGSVAILIYNKIETVKCWETVSMGDANDKIVDILVLPGDGREDLVYYLVDSNGTHYLTRWAQVSECIGGDLNKQADLFVEYDGAPISTLTGTGHLDGRNDIVVWADGEERTGPFTSSGAQIALGGTYSKVIAGTYYKAKWKSTKLAYAAQGGTALAQKKNIGPIALVMADTHIKGIKYGRSYDKMDFIPETYEGKVMPSNTIFRDYDTPAFILPGEWHSDARLHLTAEAPKPCTLMGVVMAIETSEKM